MGRKGNHAGWSIIAGGWGPGWLSKKAVFNAFSDEQPVNVTTLMMTSSNGNIFRVTGPLCGEFTGHRWIPLTKASDAELCYFLWSVPEQTVEYTIETPVIWDDIALIMTSLWCAIFCPIQVSCYGWLRLKPVVNLTAFCDNQTLSFLPQKRMSSFWRNFNHCMAALEITTTCGENFDTLWRSHWRNLRRNDNISVSVSKG